MKLIVIFASLIVCISEARKLASYIEVCKPKQVDVTQCIKKNLEILRPMFRNGIPELGIPSFNPFQVPATEIKLGNNFKASVKNIKIRMPKSFAIEEMMIDLDNFKLDFTVKIPEIIALADYKLDGKLLVLNLDGSGLGHINLYNLKAKVVATGKRETKNGKQYIVPMNIDIKPKVERMDINLENLFPTNPELTDQANRLFNDNQQILFEDFSPFVVNIIKGMLTRYITNFFGRYSYDVLFPDN